MDQYAILKSAKSFDMVTRTLSENAGLNAMEIISSLYAEHVGGNAMDGGVCKDVLTANFHIRYLLFGTIFFEIC